MELTTHNPIIEISSSEHETLSDDRLYDLVCAVGNHEGKALLLGAMQYGVQYSRIELHNLFLETQGQEPAFTGGTKNQWNYCETFETFGLAKTEPRGLGSTYTLTDYGERVGKPFAGMMLAISSEVPFALSDAFGGTNTSKGGQRPPKSILRIVEQVLLGHEPDRTHATARALGADGSAVGRLLRRLDQRGLLKYDYLPISDKVAYKLVDADKLRERGARTELSNELNMLFLANPETELTTDLIRESLGVVSSGDEEGHAIRTMINRLIGHGILERTKGREKIDFSAISFDQDQEEFWYDLLSSLYDFQTLEPSVLEANSNKLKSIIGNTSKVQKLIKKAYDRVATTSENYIDEAQKELLVRRVISAEPLSLDKLTSAINDQLGQRKKRIGTEVVAETLRTMRKEGEVVSSRARGRTLLWAIHDKGHMASEGPASRE